MFHCVAEAVIAANVLLLGLSVSIVIVGHTLEARRERQVIGIRHLKAKSEFRSNHGSAGLDTIVFISLAGTLVVSLLLKAAGV